MKISFICLFISVIPLSLTAQITFEKTYGGNGNKIGMAFQQTSDGGYILFGHANSSAGQDMYLVKTDEWGEEVWNQTFGGPLQDYGLSVQEVSSGGYILCGSFGGPNIDSLAIIRTDAEGNELWNKSYSPVAGQKVGQYVDETADGGFIAVGFTGVYPQENMFIFKTDAEGNEIWSHDYVMEGKQLAFCLRQTADGGYILFGQTDTDTNGIDMYLVRTNNVGDTLWTRTFGSEVDDIGRSMQITDDGGFILLGYEYEPGGNLLLVKTDENGDEMWSGYYGGNGWDEGHAVLQTSDGGYMMSGRKDLAEGGNDNHMFAIKTDNLGTEVWENAFPRGLLSTAHTAQTTSDEGFALFGYTTDTIGGVVAEMYLVKTDGFGIVSSIETASENIKINAWPNPFIDFTNIEINHINEPVHLTLTNIAGQKVRTIQQHGPGIFRVERENMVAGIYIFQIWAGKDVVGSGKIVVQQ